MSRMKVVYRIAYPKGKIYIVRDLTDYINQTPKMREQDGAKGAVRLVGPAFFSWRGVARR